MKQKANKNKKSDGYSILYPQVNPQEWASAYGIKVREQNCLDCGVLRVVDIPFASKKLRGFISKPCECGSGLLTTTVLADEKERREFAKIVGRIFNDPQ